MLANSRIPTLRGYSVHFTNPLTLADIGCKNAVFATLIAKFECGFSKSLEGLALDWH